MAIQWNPASQGLGNGQNSTRRLNICKCWLGNGMALCFSCIFNARCSVRNEGGVLSINCRQLHVTTFLWGFSWTALRAPQTLSTEIVLLVMLSSVSCPWCVSPLSYINLKSEPCLYIWWCTKMQTIWYKCGGKGKLEDLVKLGRVVWQSSANQGLCGNINQLLLSSTCK